MWFLAVLFFFYEYFLRAFVGTLATQIMPALSITAEELAWIGSGYYIAYALMQLPVGILIDRYGSRLLLSIACAICALAALWFGFVHHFIDAFFSRFLMGLGSAFGFIGLLAIALNWFPKKHFAFMTGLSQFLGVIGPLCAGAPLVLLMQIYDNNWRMLLISIGILGLIITLAITLFLRNRPKRSGHALIHVETPTPLAKKLTILTRTPQAWMTMLYAATNYASVPLLGAFWGTSYMQTRGFNQSTAAFIASMVWLGLAAGCPIAGKISDSIKRRKICLISLSFLGIFTSLLILYFPISSKTLLSLLFFLVGFAGSGQSVSFATIREQVSSKLKVTVLGFNNFGIISLAALVPPLVSTYMHGLQKSATINTLTAFNTGLTIIPILFTISFLIAIFFITETFCRPQKETLIVSSGQ